MSLKTTRGQLMPPTSALEKKGGKLPAGCASKDITKKRSNSSQWSVSFETFLKHIVKKKENKYSSHFSVLTYCKFFCSLNVQKSKNAGGRRQLSHFVTLSRFPGSAKSHQRQRTKPCQAQSLPSLLLELLSSFLCASKGNPLRQHNGSMALELKYRKEINYFLYIR